MHLTTCKTPCKHLSRSCNCRATHSPCRQGFVLRNLAEDGASRQSVFWYDMASGTILNKRIFARSPHCSSWPTVSYSLKCANKPADQGSCQGTQDVIEPRRYIPAQQHAELILSDMCEGSQDTVADDLCSRSSIWAVDCTASYAAGAAAQFSDSLCIAA